MHHAPQAQRPIAQPWKWVGLVAWIAVSFLPSLTAIWIDQPDRWYDELNQPAWNPPSWVFTPVWTVLYLLMGIAAWRVWVRHGFTRAGFALGAFLIHLLFNAAWTWLFFGMQQITLAAVEIVILWLFIAALVVLFYRHDRIAGWLLTPYLLWVTYAVTLNIGFVVLN